MAIKLLIAIAAVSGAAGAQLNSVSSAASFSCGLETSGATTCWGLNNFGQCDYPNVALTQISTGGSHSCGLKSDGTAVCWGKNEEGQSTPPEMTFSSVSCGGSHTCGIKASDSKASSKPLAIFFVEIALSHDEFHK